MVIICSDIASKCVSKYVLGLQLCYVKNYVSNGFRMCNVIMDVASVTRKIHMVFVGMEFLGTRFPEFIGQ